MKDNKNFYQAIVNLIQNGNSKKAIDKLLEFLEMEQNDETALSLLSSAYIRNNEHDKAIEASQSATSAHPNSFAAHADLGFLLMKLEKRAEAISSFEQAVKLNKSFYQGWGFLEKLYFENDQIEEAINAVMQSEKCDPLDSDFKRIQKAMRGEDFAEAEQIARGMLSKQPGHPRGAFALAHLAGTVGAHEQRAEILLHCLSYHPANIEVRMDLIYAYEEIGDYKRALEEAINLVKVDPGYQSYWIESRIHTHLGDHESALTSAEAAADCLEKNSEELGKIDLLRAHALRTMGRREESEEAYRACIKNTPNNGAGWGGLADLKNYKFSESDRKIMEDLIANQEIDDEQRCLAGFALAKSFETNGDKLQAFEWYKRANEMRTDANFTPERNAKFCDNRISASDLSMMERQASPIPEGPTPIFIVGMPRAGSTLIEQILSSHSQIEGTMELTTLPKLERKIKITGGQKYNTQYPESLNLFSEAELSEFGQTYIDTTEVYRTDKPFFIDKMPPNFELIGLIHKILPQAIIIDARRNPLDCGYSAFRQHFAGGHIYSYDLSHIGHYYNGYLQFMDHWDKVLPGKVMCVQYEEMIHDTEGMVRSILDHIGVEFEESCLKFYENKRAVKTASSEQVRQPIYTKGIGQWKPVEKELKPLIDSLGSDTLKRFEKYLS